MRMVPPASVRSRSGAVALLELLAGAARAEVVAPDLVVLGGDSLLGGDTGGSASQCARLGSGCDHRPGPGGRDRFGSGQRLVLVGIAVAVLPFEALHLLERRRVLGLHLGVEEQRDDLGANLVVEL